MNLKPLLTAGIAALTFVSAHVHAQAVVIPPSPMNLSKPPLFLNAQVDPNLVVTFDDSGSMSYGFTPDEIDDIQCHFRHPGYYSSSLNVQYFNPNITYTPPLRADGTRFPDSSFDNAEVNGFNTGGANYNLGTQYFVNRADGNVTNYGLNNGARPPVEYTYANCINGTQTSATRFKFPTGSANAFYCTFEGDLDVDGDATLTDDGNYTCTTGGIPAAQQTNFANWFSYYRLRGDALKSAVSRAFGVLDDDIRVAIQNMNNNALATATTIGKFRDGAAGDPVTTRRTNFFNSLFTSPYNGNTPTLTSTDRVTAFFERNTGAADTNPYWDRALSRELSCRQNFHVLVSDGYWNQSTHPTGSPAAGASTSARTLPDSGGVINPSPLTYANQSYSLSDPASRIIWDGRARGTNCNSGSGNVTCDPSFTDIAFHGWYRDLRTNLANNVPIYMPNRTTGVTGAPTNLATLADIRQNAEVYWHPANDPASWQHVVQFFIGFGISGRVPFNNASVTALRTGGQWATGETQWPGPRNLAPEAVDDIWRGTMASRGQAFGATDPTAVVDALTDILSSIVQRKGSASAVSVSTGIVRSGSLAYQTQFDSTDWTGTVISRPVNTDLSFGSPTWDAGCLLTGGDCVSTNQTGLPGVNWNTGRKILTSNSVASGGNGVPFRWASLSAAQRAAMEDNPATVAVDPDGLGERRLEYIRGDRSRERQNGGPFRNRSSVFGAVVHSGAIVIGPPAPDEYNDRLWPAGSPELPSSATDLKYRAFAAAQASRPQVVYVGANDGMLHALLAATGEELWSYVPYAATIRGNKLTNPTFQFEPFVDNSVTVRDVFINGAYRSMLVGTMRRGGQSVFALDVTRPETITEGTANANVLWEFNDTSPGGANLGYTYGVPFITRVNAGNKWVVLVPAGYNSEEADGTVGNGKAVLFVLDALNGSVLREFNLGAIDTNARGLASPIAIDTNFDDVSETAYAGDLAGNIWRFDLTAATAAAWTVTRFYRPTTAFSKPITAQPRSERNPDSKQPMVFVGTGKYIENDDRSRLIPEQAFYGIEDDGSGGTVNETQLNTRTLITAANGLRSVSAVTAATGSPVRGFKIRIGATGASSETGFQGERVVSTAALRIVGRRVIYSTLLPSGDDPCLPGGTSFILFADFATGGTAFDGYAYFDTNANNDIDAGDNANVVGKAVQTLVPGIASVLPPGGGIGGIVLPPGGGTAPPNVIRTREFEWRRRSWRELFRQNSE